MVDLKKNRQTLAFKHRYVWMGGKLLPPALQVYGRWLNFEELCKISHLELDLHILDLNRLGHDYF